MGRVLMSHGPTGSQDDQSRRFRPSTRLAFRVENVAGLRSTARSPFHPDKCSTVLRPPQPANRSMFLSGERGIGWSIQVGRSPGHTHDLAAKPQGREADFTIWVQIAGLGMAVQGEWPSREALALLRAVPRVSPGNLGFTGGTGRALRRGRLAKFSNRHRNRVFQLFPESRFRDSGF